MSKFLVVLLLVPTLLASCTPSSKTSLGDSGASLWGSGKSVVPVEKDFPTATVQEVIAVESSSGITATASTR